jgi:hypothetical protein
VYFPGEIPGEDIDLIIGEWKLAGVKVIDARPFYTVHSVLSCFFERQTIRYDLVDGDTESPFYVKSFDSLTGGWLVDR